MSCCMSRLKAWRVEKGLSQEALGSLLGVSSVAVGRYERDRVPEPAVLQKLTELTEGDVTPNDFFEIPAVVRPTSKPRRAA